MKSALIASLVAMLVPFGGGFCVAMAAEEYAWPAPTAIYVGAALWAGFFLMFLVAFGAS